ncbi:helix-turn-helix domain-containing protein, partial [Klebsiella pneumoniae]|uniref:helix-turn-helix domain-containing protein n=1 Tax=Klebsiella pneumoniae TaxID=573 RepID=UPI003969047F
SPTNLIGAVSRTIRGWELPQKDAAARLHVTQPRLNELLKGKIDKFSLDALVNLLDAADLTLEISVIPRAV